MQLLSGRALGFRSRHHGSQPCFSAYSNNIVTNKTTLLYGVDPWPWYVNSFSLNTLTSLYFTNKKVTEKPTKTKTQRNVPMVIRVKRWRVQIRTPKKLQIPKGSAPHNPAWITPLTATHSTIPPGGPDTLLHPPGSRLRGIEAEFHRPHRSLPTFQDTPARPKKRPYQVGVGGPLQSCWWSLLWAPRSPARSLQSRTTWRVPGGRPGSGLERSWGHAGQGKQSVRTRKVPRERSKWGQLPGRPLPVVCSSRSCSSGSWAECVFQFPFRLQD